MNEPLRQVYQVYIRTTPERLWQALIDPEMTRQYFYESLVESDWKVGSPLNRNRANGERMLSGEIVEIEPMRRLVHTFSAQWYDDPPSRVTWEIQPLGEACKLTVTHEHYNGESEAFKGTLTGWNPILSGLKTLLETGVPLIIGSPCEAPAPVA